MKYYLMCKKLLGQKQFDELVRGLTTQIIAKFSSDILLDRYMEILEYNIKIIMLISISNVLELDNTEKSQKICLKDAKEFFVAETISEFIEKNTHFVNKITDLLK